MLATANNNQMVHVAMKHAADTEEGQRVMKIFNEAFDLLVRFGEAKQGERKAYVNAMLRQQLMEERVRGGVLFLTYANKLAELKRGAS
jgi:hypothetical protein